MKKYKKYKKGESVEFSINDSYLVNMKKLCNLTKISRDIIEKFYTVNLERIINVIGLPVVSSNIDGKLSFVREYSFREKCFVIQAASDRYCVNLKKDAMRYTLDLDKIIDIDN